MKTLKKIAVIIPVLVLTWVFFRTNYFHQYQHASGKRLLMFGATLLLFYAWIITGIVRRPQQTFFDIVVQSSFYVYIFSVLTLTGYFVLFNQVSAHHWWQNTLQRIHLRDGVNITPWLFMRARHWWLYYEVVGNFIMLLPLGIYLPLLYKRMNNFFIVVFAGAMVSGCIELMQLASSFRVADIDDVILNTSGAAVGYILFLLIKAAFIKPFQSSTQVQAYS